MSSLKKTYTNIVTAKHKNLKPVYYLKNFLKLKILPQFTHNKLDKKLKKIKKFDINYIQNRVNYYNKLENETALKKSTGTLQEFIFDGKEKTYFFDTWKYTRFFKPEYKFAYRFGDVTQIPDEPAIVKSRPINGKNQNAVLLNLNKIRHFIYVNESKSLSKKKDQLVWRGNIWKHQPQRILFLEKHFNNPLCNVGHVNKADLESKWQVDKLNIVEQLNYKFILSLEGNDVATNLKWIMSSHSVAVMPTPKYETWFMEGTLIPDYHYIHIKDDYSDLNDKLNYYIHHPEKTEEIRKNANKYIHQFKNKEREDLISLLVLQKYFFKTNL
ncbi:glycosyl transferase family 90 [Saccharicrinis fermentans]|uniref:glycosyl transferase family 90 n=1 Tax=Saccharicrinis fermentans TaxID=982 RepID=UPI0004AFE0F9|nr:glycosyl transferase family 90 [Saccharicrinis fermentans]